MATYKLIQDIEAEDHILGPLTLRQFIFALISAFLLYICFISVAKHAAVLLTFFLPPALFCGFFAFPWGGDQPTELWALAKLRFWFKPRRRIWNQSGIKELVTITVPKKVERVYSDGLSQTEVKSRLQALANTIDSRGWAIKHINAVGYMPQSGDSDRLIDIPEVPPQEVPGAAGPTDDIMDENHSPIAQQFQTMINQSTQNYRERLVEQLKAPLPEPQAPQPQAAPAGQQWFMNHNPAATSAPQLTMPAPDVSAPAILPAPVPSPAPAPAPVAAASDEPLLSTQLKQMSSTTSAYGNLRTLQPLGAKTAVPAPAAPAPDDTSAAMTASGDPAILSLSKNNDLNVATLAREAQRAKQVNSGSQNEVVVSLH